MASCLLAYQLVSVVVVVGCGIEVSVVVVIQANVSAAAGSSVNPRLWNASDTRVLSANTQCEQYGCVRVNLLYVRSVTYPATTTMTATTTSNDDDDNDDSDGTATTTGFMTRRWTSFRAWAGAPGINPHRVSSVRPQLPFSRWLPSSHTLLEPYWPPTTTTNAAALQACKLIGRHAEIAMSVRQEIRLPGRL